MHVIAATLLLQTGWEWVTAAGVNPLYNPYFKATAKLHTSERGLC